MRQQILLARVVLALTKEMEPDQIQRAADQLRSVDDPDLEARAFLDAIAENLEQYVADVR